jgi:hypothetical protein
MRGSFAAMEKLVYLVWERPSVEPASLGKQFLGDIGPRLIELGAHRVQIDLDDEHAQVDTMVPIPPDELPVRACVSLWLDAHDHRTPYEAVLADAGVRRAGYLVTESLYRDYDERTWRDGERSPGIITLTVFDKPANVDDATFYGHWYGHQSPMSEAMQPRVRYVRNAVARSLTVGAPPYRAIVEEAWPTVEHLTNLHTFFGATTNEELGENVRVMLDSTKLLYDPATMRNYTLSEYILKR